jgi:hypothetical protein
MVYKFDELKLIAELERLSPSLRAAIAVAAAERLLPAYLAFSERTGRGDGKAAASILERLWADLQGRPMGSEELKATEEICMGLIPSEMMGRGYPSRRMRKMQHQL